MTFKRREFLATAGLGLAGGLAGCSGQQVSSSGSTATETESGGSGGSGSGTPTPEKRQASDERVVTGEELNEYEPVELEIQSYTRGLLPQRYEWTFLFRDQWIQNLGVDATVRIGEVSKIFGNWVDVNYDVNMAGWSGKPSRIDPATFLNAFRTDGGLYTPNYSNSEYDEVVEKAQSATDRERRQELVYRAQEILAEDQPVVFLFAPNALTATNTANWSNYTSQIGDQNYTQVWNLQSMEPTGNVQAAVKAGNLFPATLNPLAPTKSGDLMGLKMVYDRLIRLGPKGQPEPWAATDWESPDPSTVDVTLREGMTWHDGEPVTPEDVKFTIEYLQEWTVPYMKSFYSGIDSVEVTGSNTVRFNLPGPRASFTGVDLALLFIIPKHVWDGLAEREGLEHPKNWQGIDYVGSGPFTVREFSKSDRVVFEVYDDHFADFDVDSFIWNKYGGKTAALGDVEAGKASFVESLQASQYNRVNGMSQIGAENISQHGWKAIYMNNGRRPFDDPVFRKAAAHATNKERVAEVVYDGLVDVMNGPIAPANEFWHNPDLPGYTGGPETARDMLFEAGYRWNEDGTLLMPKA
jgi:peptide/nickel transport system substrate-binding protein